MNLDHTSHITEKQLVGLYIKREKMKVSITTILANLLSMLAVSLSRGMLSANLLPLLLCLPVRINLVPHRAVNLLQEPRDVLGIVNQNLFVSKVWFEVLLQVGKSSSDLQSVSV